MEPLVDSRALKIRGRHNLANALAALALGEAAGLPMAPMLQALKAFGGLEHRCQWVADRCGLHWFNDSKGTNVGATLAALNGIGATLEGESRILLIAGGVGKGQSFAALDKPLGEYARALILIGEDGPRIGQAVSRVEKHQAADMEAAVAAARALARPGDVVLLSPACASFDMFSGYPARGRAFVQAVEATAMRLTWPKLSLPGFKPPRLPCLRPWRPGSRPGRHTRGCCPSIPGCCFPPWP